eukprot:12446076-Alexandrium_andersonii.AAC.1
MSSSTGRGFPCRRVLPSPFGTLMLPSAGMLATGACTVCVCSALTRIRGPPRRSVHPTWME